MKKLFVYNLVILIALFLALPFVSAHCPLCTGAAVAGIGAARYFGVDDSIVGLFIGAFIVSSGLWFNKWLLKKKIKFKFQETLLVLVSFLLFVVPLYFAGVITNFEMVRSMPEHHSILGLGVLGIDRLFFGIIVGSIFIWSVFKFSDYIKNKKGKTLWKYQGISFMFITLVILSLIFWLITK